ncbi:thioesterase domain-containing protein [Fulvivirga ulvae]|uniref:thioesterase II family protein n=1 Tax=Fulvivirga ulvae TaxID=2904245 RepID=UPI001F1D00F6|nr:thioesterase domain-containing protein [Fulvivirga ulvae]UII31857.1 thioesterase domain-containing protein [Fulvivirga ulvae]
MSKLKLFAFPYAGGSSSIYHGLKPLLRDHIEFIPVELAGRGRRIGDGLYSGLAEAVDDIYKIVSPQIKFSPFAFFGHSMGSLLAHELTVRLQYELGLSPSHLFFSGRGAIQVKRKDEKMYHKMDEKRFKEEILLLGGTPPEFFEHPELLELFLPLLKNDFRIAETTPDIEGFKQSKVDITVFTGKEDDLTKEQVQGWKEYTNGTCEIHEYSGGHFFIHQEMSSIAKVINDTITQLVTH